MRPRLPELSGSVERDGVRVAYDAYGEGDGAPTILLLPAWSIVNSRVWKAQVPYLARHFRVVTLDGRGSGRSSRPVGAPAYDSGEYAADAVAVLDATRTDAAVLVGLSAGTLWGVRLAAEHPDRVIGLVAIGGTVPLVPGHAERVAVAFDEPLARTDGWAKCNRFYWERDYAGFLEFFFGRVSTETHSTKQIEDGIGWGSEVEPLTLADTLRAIGSCRADDFRGWCDAVRCPVMVLHGDEDAIRPHAGGAALAAATGGRLVTIAGGGHTPTGRDPVFVNRLIREFVASVAMRRAAADRRDPVRGRERTGPGRAR